MLIPGKLYRFTRNYGGAAWFVEQKSGLFVPNQNGPFYRWNTKDVLLYLGLYAITSTRTTYPQEILFMINKKLVVGVDNDNVYSLVED